MAALPWNCTFCTSRAQQHVEAFRGLLSPLDLRRADAAGQDEAAPQKIWPPSAEPIVSRSKQVSEPLRLLNPPGAIRYAETGRSELLAASRHLCCLMKLRRPMSVHCTSSSHTPNRRWEVRAPKSSKAEKQKNKSQSPQACLIPKRTLGPSS